MEPSTLPHDNTKPILPPKASARALVISASDKAGMEGIDRTLIDAIILRESGDSNFMKQQRKRDGAVDEKIQKMKNRLSDIETAGSNWRGTKEKELEAEVGRLRGDRRRLSTCVVVDMDSFYISCELLSRPDLHEVSCCVGGGMILTSNYRARRYGVRSAMAGWIGDKLVDELSGGNERLVHIPPDFDLYTKKSHLMRKALAEYDPHLRAYSLDEAYLDIGPYLEYRVGRGWDHEKVCIYLLSTKEGGLAKATIEEGEDCPWNDGHEADETGCHTMSHHFIHPAASDIVAEMRAKVKLMTGGLTCSAGLASNFMLAKIASDMKKPDGQLVIGPSNEEILQFLRDLNVRKIPGIGRVTEKMLNAFGITSVKELYKERAIIQFLFQPATATFLLRASLGWSISEKAGSPEDEDSRRKGIGRERTFQPKSWTEVHSKLEEITRNLAEDMKTENLFAHTLTVKVKLSTFDVMSKSKSMEKGKYIQTFSEIFPMVSEMLLDLKKQHMTKQNQGNTFSVRLLGVRCSNFLEENEKPQICPQQQGIQKFMSKRSQTNNDTFLNYGTSGSAKETECVVSKIAPQVCEASTTQQLNNKAVSSPNPKSPLHSPRNKQLEIRPLAQKLIHDEMGPQVKRGSTGKHTSPSPLLSSSSSVDNHNCIKCPICSKIFSLGDDNDALNCHIDACLNASTVRKLIQEESPAKTSPKKRRMTDFFGP